jgi:hypothetical protein
MSYVNDNINPPNHNGVIPTGTRIELRLGCEDLYVKAEAGWRAYVRDRKLDEHGFEMIFIEWDRTYWRYQPGQSDGWAFPNHFNVVGLNRKPEPGEKVEDPQIDLQQMADDLTSLIDPEPDPDVCEGCGEVHTDEDRREAYVDILADAATLAAEGEGFALVLVANSEDEDGNPRMQPQFFSLALSDKARVMIESQLVDVAQGIIQDMNIDRLRDHE